MAAALEVGERDVADRQQARVDRAEVDDGPVVGPGDAVGVVEIVAVLGVVQLVVVEGVEDELALEAEEVEGERTVLLDEGAGGPVVLPEPDLLGVPGPVLRIAVLLAGLFDPVELRLVGNVVDRLQLGPHVGVGVGRQPVWGLHDVGVGVVHGSHASQRTPAPI